MQMLLGAEISHRLATDAGMSAQDYAVLVVLTDRADGRARMYELADAIGWERSRVSHHINRMVKRGLIAKAPCDEDRRGAFVVITPKGCAEIEAAAPGHLADVRELFVDLLSREQLDAMADIAEAVLAGLRGSAVDR